MTDMQGRLQGKRLTAEHFLDEVADHGAEGCNYLLAVDVDMTPVDGYEIASWEKGYGDFAMRPDLDTLRLAPWQPGTALCLADLEWADGSDVTASPRQILRAQLARLAEHGWTANASTELEFLVFKDSYEDAWHKGYRDLNPANLYNVDYSLLGTAKVEPLIRRIRNSMAAPGSRSRTPRASATSASTRSTSATPTRCARPMSTRSTRTRPRRSPTRRGWRSASWPSSTSARAARATSTSRSPISPAPCSRATAGTFDAFVAGQLACLRELTLLLAPNVNSYKRFAEGSFAPTAVAWGNDNRTCALRVVGHGPALRFENRAGGSDLNPYLALSALIAAGLHGVDNQLRAGARLRRATRTSRATSRACPPRCVRHAICSLAPRWRGRHSATRWSITTPTRPTSNSVRSRPR